MLECSGLSSGYGMHMEHKLLIGGVSALCVAAGLGFWAGRRSAAVVEPGILTAQVNTLADGWEARNVPATDRVVNIVVSGAEAGSPAVKPSARYTGGETILLADKPSIWLSGRPASWCNNAQFRRRIRKAQPDNCGPLPPHGQS